MSVILISALIAGPMTAAPVAPPAVVVQAGPRSVPVGDPLRRTLLNTLRPSIEDELNQPVQFMVDRLRVQGDWAFYAGSVQQPNGRPIDFSKTRYASALENGVFDGPGTFALLRRTAGTWRVVTFVVGPTDVAYLAWPDEHGAPMRLFE
ncbi:MAG: hypothetical protein B7Y85_02490 [Brevundimonas sp. 32-68-21]|nr:MAG: hypothetical protein B7Y85_02490 [Brevundimonas sp. 32-68-21]